MGLHKCIRCFASRFFTVTGVAQAVEYLAGDVLSKVRPAIEGLPTPEERFAATRPLYEALIRAGFLHRLIPEAFGGGGSGMIDMAVVAEEFHAVDVNVSLTMIANLLGSSPIFIAGTQEQRRRFIVQSPTHTTAHHQTLAGQHLESARVSGKVG